MAATTGSLRDANRSQSQTPGGNLTVASPALIRYIVDISEARTARGPHVHFGLRDEPAIL